MFLLTAVFCLGAAAVEPVEVAPAPEKLQLQGGVAQETHGIKLTASAFGYAHTVGDDNFSSCTVTATRGKDTAKANLGHVHSGPITYQPVLDVWVGLDWADAYGDPGSASIYVSKDHLTVDDVVTRLAAAKPRSTEAFTPEQRQVVDYVRRHPEQFVKLPAQVLVDALGPPEEAWGLEPETGTMRWEIGVLPQGLRSAPPMLEVRLDDAGNIGRIQLRLAM